MRRLRSRWARGAALGIGALGAIAALVVLPAAPASAHPLGNFTVNTSSGLRIAPDRIDVHFVVDMAEIPTLQADQQMDRNGDGRSDPPEQEAWRQARCADIADHVSLAVDGRPLAIHASQATLEHRPGQAGLTTLRLTCELAIAFPGTLTGEHAVAYATHSYTDRIGWREITAVGDRMTLVASDVPARSTSAELTAYPKNLLSSPLDQRSAALRIRAGGPAVPAAADGPVAAARFGVPLPRGVDQATQAFTSFVGRRRLSLAFALLALLASLILGAVHALAPGHGKTVMAAYLVGEQGSLREALAVGLTVTATHTVGVLALGVAISASAVLTPERLYPWLGLATGILIVAIGAGILSRTLRHRAGDHNPGHHHRHAHGHGHDHGHHHGHHHDDGHDDHVDRPVQVLDPPVTTAPRRRVLSKRDLLAIGFVGGFLPSPSAVVVLLGAMALGRAWFGVVLVLAYGAGMAATLTGAGLALLRMRGVLEHRLSRSSRSRTALLSRAVPLVAAATIMVIGSALTLRALLQIPR